MRDLQASAMAAATPQPPAAAAASVGVHTDTFLIFAAVLCFLLCVVGLTLVARCARLCNPSAYSVDAEAMPAAAAAPCKGLKRKALQALPTVPFEEADEEPPECAICLAAFARGDEVRVLPACGHGFHAACVDVWLLSSSTCPSCRRALVAAAPCCAPPPAQASAEAEAEAARSEAVAGERHLCQTSVRP